MFDSLDVRGRCRITVGKLAAHVGLGEPQMQKIANEVGAGRTLTYAKFKSVMDLFESEPSQIIDDATGSTVRPDRKRMSRAGTKDRELWDAGAMGDSDSDDDANTSNNRSRLATDLLGVIDDDDENTNNSRSRISGIDSEPSGSIIFLDDNDSDDDSGEDVGGGLATIRPVADGAHIIQSTSTATTDTDGADEQGYIATPRTQGRQDRRAIRRGNSDYAKATMSFRDSNN